MAFNSLLSDDQKDSMSVIEKATMTGKDSAIEKAKEIASDAVNKGREIAGDAADMGRGLASDASDAMREMVDT